MDLEFYRRPRMVVQHPDTPVHEAARAMECNRIGMVMVQERGRLVGIVTDRDLALRVVAAGLDPASLVLKDVMSRDPHTLSIDATIEQALEMMRAHRVRRIPLVEGHHVVGVISIDDLVLAGMADALAISEVILEQLAHPAGLKPAGFVHPTKPAVARGDDGSDSDRARRREARMLQTAQHAARTVEYLTGLKGMETALDALTIVVEDLVRRLTPSEAHDLLAQLPKELERRLVHVPRGPDEDLTRERIELHLVHRLHIEPEQAPQLLDRLGLALETLVSPGEIAHVRAQLPRDMKSIFPML